MPYFITVTCMWSHDSLLLDYLTLHSVSNYFIYFFILQLKYPAEVLLCNCTTVASIYLELLFCSCPSVLLWYSAAIRIQNQISLKVWFYIPEWIFFKHSIIFYLFLFVYFYRLNWIQTFILLYNLSLSTVKNIHPGKCFIRHSWILCWESPIVLSICCLLYTSDAADE